ncbi:copper resistance CopC/CopD family protein [Smaragdicoccus niigatensis]|uniref:copper resistance CopC/CopD family protein n=1 Tax=Smaragdicoccus niigatensis TaxID=359359 RepID=UPI000373F0D0|nr:copper resistance protein CopC [Smaragdicoccus niigatensis]
MKRASAALVMWVLLFLGAAAPASAHAVLLSTSPGDGEVVTSEPEDVTLTFNEPVTVREVSIVSTGRPQELPARTVDAIVHATLPPGLAEGSYIVSWRVISDDGHPIGGALTFSIGHASTTNAVAEIDHPGVTWLIRIAQALAYLGLLVSCGLALFQAWVAREVSDDRLRRIGLAAAATAAVGLVIGLPAFELDADGTGLSGLFAMEPWTSGIRSGAGAMAVLGIAGTTVATVFRNRCIRIAGAVAGLASLPAMGHSRTFEPPILVIGADLIHVLAVSAWIGGLIGLVVLFRRPEIADVISRFSRIAAWLLAALVTTGLILGWRIVGSWDALFHTGYGQVLLAKVALVAVAVAIAYVNRQRLSTPSSARLRSESAVLFVVAALTGVLVHLNPTLPVQQLMVMKQENGVLIHAAIAPCRIGENTVTVMVQGAQVEAPTITAQMTTAGIGPLNVPVTAQSSGEFTAPLTLRNKGQWTIDVTVRISKYQESTTILTCTP